MSDNTKAHITFLDGVDGRAWFIAKGGKWLNVDTEGMKDLLKQLKVLESLDWKSPF